MWTTNKDHRAIIPVGDLVPGQSSAMRVTRRKINLLLIGAGVLTAGAAVRIGGNEATRVSRAVQFIQQSGERLIAILSGSADWETKRVWVEQLIGEVVDVRGIVRFALARVWHLASDTQRQEIVRFFPRVMVGAVVHGIGSFNGVRFTITRAIEREQQVAVRTTVMSEGGQPREVNWIVGEINGELKILDIIGEGSSLRIVQREECGKFLARNNDNIPALISWLLQRASGTMS